MEELYKYNEAIKIIERYADYMCRKAWGKTLIIWGILAPISLVIQLNSENFSKLFSMNIETFTIFSTSILLIISIGLTIYLFGSVSKVINAKNKGSFESPKVSNRHGFIIGSIWFLTFFLIGLIPEPFSILSSIWAGGISMILSFLLLRYYHDKFIEILLVGGLLLIFSIPLMFIVSINEGIARILVIVIFSICFLSGGFCSYLIAKKILQGEQVWLI